jgi:hypothetical protein
MGFERNYQIKVLSKQLIVNKYSTSNAKQLLPIGNKRQAALHNESKNPSTIDP